jgi:hypothetical protein
VSCPLTAKLRANVAADLLQAAAASTTQSRRYEVPHEYTIGSLSFTGALKPGGDTVTINGTAEEIFNQLREKNPNYDSDFSGPLSAHGYKAEFESGKGTPSVSTLQKHSVRDCALKRRAVSQTFCDIGQGAYMNILLQDGIPHLRGLVGSCRIRGDDSGHGACDRVSCSWESGVWFCNDVSAPPLLPCALHLLDG